jgi:hypothetical protein
VLFNRKISLSFRKNNKRNVKLKQAIALELTVFNHLSQLTVNILNNKNILKNNNKSTSKSQWMLAIGRKVKNKIFIENIEV